MPRALYVVRHGESVGNVAWREAESRGVELIDVSPRDADVPLSELGLRQARALGRWLRAQAAAELPSVVYCSPYRRTHATALALLDAAGLAHLPLVADERLREKELGVLNRLTRAGIAARFPDEVALRAALGKFYYRPPNGESWCDVVLRLRSFLDTEMRKHAGERVLVVSHSVVTLCLRYLLEGLDEAQLLAIDGEEPIANASLTTYLADGEQPLGLDRFNFTVPTSGGVDDAG